MMKEEGKSYEINVVGDKDVLKSEDRIGGGGQQAQAQNHSMEFHRKVLEKRLGEQGYVSVVPFFHSFHLPFLSFFLGFLKKRRMWQ